MSEIPLTQAPAHVRHGSNIGQPLTRRDGILKVTGGARYAADNHPPDMLYAVLAVSSISRGRVAFLDVVAAKAHPGVVDVMTPASTPPLAQASRRIDATYETLAQYHNAMEPHAIVAAWDGDKLSIDMPTQGLAMTQGRLAELFGLPVENIHIRSRFLGGGFGG
jgi:CO/xanthine dehydrogenase Mo-binding subunit